MGYNWYAEKKHTLFDFKNPFGNWFNHAYYTDADVAFYNISFRPFWVRTPRWRFSTPIDLGLGAAIEDKTNIREHFLWKGKEHFVPFQLGFQTDFVASRYVGAKMLLGYRTSLKRTEIPFKTNGIYYTVTYSIYLTTIYRDLKKIIRHEKLY